MGSHVIVQVVFASELFVTSAALKTADPVVFSRVAVQIGLIGELHATLVADKRLDAPVAEGMGVQQGLSGISLLTQLTLEGASSHHPMLPHVVVKVALGYEGLLADLAGKRPLALVNNPEK